MTWAESFAIVGGLLVGLGFFAFIVWLAVTHEDY